MFRKPQKSQIHCSFAGCSTDHRAVSLSQGKMDGDGSYGLILRLDKNTHPEGLSATEPRKKRDSNVLLMLQRFAQASLSCTLPRGGGMLFYWELFDCISGILKAPWVWSKDLLGLPVWVLLFMAWLLQAGGHWPVKALLAVTRVLQRELAEAKQPTGPATQTWSPHISALKEPAKPKVWMCQCQQIKL